MDDIFPTLDRRGAIIRRVPPMTIPIGNYSRDVRLALMILLTGPASMTAGGWTVAATIIRPAAMQEMISDRLVAIAPAGFADGRMLAALTPRGKMYATACLHDRRRMDALSAAITPPRAG